MNRFKSDEIWQGNMVCEHGWDLDGNSTRQAGVATLIEREAQTVSYQERVLRPY